MRISSDRFAKRRMLAIVKAAHGDYQQNRQALALLGLLDDAQLPEAAAGATVADRRTQAIVLATQKDKASHQRAITILEGLDALDLNPDDQFLLGRMYESVGDWPKAKARYRQLLAKHADRLPNVCLACAACRASACCAKGRCMLRSKRYWRSRATGLRCRSAGS